MFYKEDNERAFYELLNNSYGVISDYFENIGLEVRVDEGDGYAYLINKVYEDEKDALPKLINQRELNYKTSLLCVLLRKKIADFEMQSDNERAIITKEDIVSSLVLFLDMKFNEVKLLKEVDTTIKKVQELGFLKKIKTDDEVYEIKSSIKAFVDAFWLNEFDKKLKELDEKKINHLIRYSGTENKLRVLLECKDAKEMNKNMDDLVEFFQKALNG